VSTSAPSVVVERGRILAYRVFDVGDTIALQDAENRTRGVKRVDLGGPLVEGLVIPARPIEIDLGECDLEVERVGRTLQARASAHVFDFGVVSVLYRIEIAPGTTLAELTPLCDALYDAGELEKQGAEHRKEVARMLGPCVEAPHDWAEAETYTIVFAEEISGVPLAELPRSQEVAKLLLGETNVRPLSEGVREDVLKNSFSYLTDDLVIVDWNSALVVEPSGSMVVPFVLELATSQLLEFRYYDGLLDRELTRVYQHVERARPRIIRSPYGALTREVLRRYMELTEFTERVDNAIKAVGDFWLARVYLSAIRRFRVPEWRESVESKVALVGRAYGLLKGEVESSRMQTLEIIVIVLIFLELINSLRH
jgi:hypothetical protein